MPKGSNFEREVCKKLSLWWTKGRKDDIFWRTAGSGGRATNRHKVNKRTAGSYGDICCLDEIGKPLLDVFTFELKRGYSRHSVADLLDKGKKSAIQEYEHWIDQAQSSYNQAGSISWLIITRRDMRVSLVVYPGFLEQELSLSGIYVGERGPMIPYANMTIRVKGDPVDIVITTLDVFLSTITPDIIRDISRRL